MIEFAAVTRRFKTGKEAGEWFDRTRSDGIIVDGDTVRPTHFTTCHTEDMVTVEASFVLKAGEPEKE